MVLDADALRRQSLAQSRRYSVVKTLRELYHSACKDFGCRPSQELLRRWGDTTTQNDISCVELGGVLRLGTGGLMPALRVVREGCKNVAELSFRDAQVNNRQLAVLCQNIRLMKTVTALDFSENPLTSAQPLIAMLQEPGCGIEKVGLGATMIPKGQRLVIEHRTSRNRHVERRPCEYFPQEVLEKLLADAPRDVHGLYLEDPAPGLVRFAERKGWRLSLTGRGAPGYEVSPYLVDTQGEDAHDHLELQGEKPVLWPDVLPKLPESLGEYEGATRMLFQCFLQTVGALDEGRLRTLLTPSAMNPHGFYTLALHIGGGMRYMLLDDDVSPTVSLTLPSIRLPTFHSSGIDGPDAFGASPLFIDDPHDEDAADRPASRAAGTRAAWRRASSSHASFNDFGAGDEDDAAPVENPFFDETCETRSLAWALVWKAFVLLKSGVGLDASALYAWLAGHEAVTFSLDRTDYNAVWETLRTLSSTLPPAQCVGFAKARDNAGEGLSPGHVYRIRKVMRNQFGRFLLLRNKTSEGTMADPTKLAWTGKWGEGSYEQEAHADLYRKLWVEPEEGDVLIDFQDFYKHFATCGVSFQPPEAPRRCYARGRWLAENGYEQIYKVTVADVSTASVVLAIFLPPHHTSQMMSITVSTGEGAEPIPPPPHIDLTEAYAFTGIVDTHTLPLKIDLPRGSHFVIVRLHPPPVYLAAQYTLNTLNDTAPPPTGFEEVFSATDQAFNPTLPVEDAPRPATSPTAGNDPPRGIVRPAPLQQFAAADEPPRPATAISFALPSSRTSPNLERPITTQTALSQGLFTAYSSLPNTRGASPQTVCSNVALTALSGTFQDRPATTTSITASEKFVVGDDFLSGFDMHSTLPQFDTTVSGGADARNGVAYRLLAYLATTGVTKEDGSVSLERISGDRGWHASSAEGSFARSVELDVQGEGTPLPFGLTIGGGEVAGAPSMVAVLMELETNEHVDYQLTFRVCIGAERMVGPIVHDRVLAPSRPSSVAKAPAKTPTLQMLLPMGEYSIIPHVYPAGVAGKLTCRVWARDNLVVKPMRPLSTLRHTAQFRRVAAMRMRLMIRIPSEVLASRPSTRVSTRASQASNAFYEAPGCKDVLLTLASPSSSGLLQFTIAKMVNGREVHVATSESLPFASTVLFDPPVGTGGERAGADPEVELRITARQFPAAPRDASMFTVCYDPSYYAQRGQVELSALEAMPA